MFQDNAGISFKFMIAEPYMLNENVNMEAPEAWPGFLYYVTTPSSHGDEHIRGEIPARVCSEEANTLSLA